MRTFLTAWNPLEWVKDLLGVWRDTRLIVLTAQVAAVYATILIPFKVGIPLIPGFAELRPANAIPIVTSLLFGPAAAWGAGIGNIIGDCFGTLGPASVFGFIGNFLFGYVPYVLWGNMGPLSSGMDPIVRSWRQGLEYGFICLVASWVCASSIAWGVDLLGLLPFTILAPAIFFNNVVMGLLLGPPLLIFLYPRVKRWGLLYQDLRIRGALQSKTMAPSHAKIQDGSNARSQARAVPFVEMENVTFQYHAEDQPVLRSVSIRVNQGESQVLMGGTGSGKSTLCFMLNGLIPQFLGGQLTGVVTVNGRDTRNTSVWQQAGIVGLVFQDFDTQLVSTNVEMELAFPLEHLNPAISPAEMRNKIMEALDRVGLSGLARRDPHSLSGGQRQRLVIASILIREPRLLVMDQPLTDLDPQGRRQLMEVVAKLKKEGLTLVLAEHDPEEILDTEQVSILDRGQVKWQGSPMELFSQPALPEQLGIRPLPIAECFTGLGLSRLPVTVEEAWMVTEERGLMLQPSWCQEQGFPGAGEKNRSDEAGETQEVLKLEQVFLTYPGDVRALKNVSLTIHAGEIVAILGENGSGKSTLAKCFNGLLRPTRGRVFVCGNDARAMTISELAFHVGYVFQNPDHQIFAETVWEEVAFGSKNVGCSSEECEQRVAEALGAVGLGTRDVKHLDPFSLTKGERQRVAVASVLAAKPNILIFDEPTTGLDAQETDRMMNMIRYLNRQGHTILIVTHAMWLAAQYAHRCVLLKDGQILAHGPTRSIFADPELVKSASLDIPPITLFGQRWGQTWLTVEEVRSALTSR